MGIEEFKYNLGPDNNWTIDFSQHGYVPGDVFYFQWAGSFVNIDVDYGPHQFPLNDQNEHRMTLNYGMHVQFKALSSFQINWRPGLFSGEANTVNFDALTAAQTEALKTEVTGFSLGGDDIIRLGSKAVTWFNAGDGNDTLFSNTNGGSLQGGNGNDTFVGYSGNDGFDGGNDADTVIYQINRSDVTMRARSEHMVDVQGNGIGTDTLTDIEKIQFADQAYNLKIKFDAALISEANLNSLIDLYVAYFNRVPEASGLSYWIDQIVGGKSLDAIAVEFYQAGIQFSDVTGYTADMPLSEFIGVLYENVLARVGDKTPTQYEIDYWVNEVNTGYVSREGLVARFLHDAREFYGDLNVGYVPELLDNKIEFGRLHAVTYGIDYLSQEEAIEKTVNLASAVTAMSIDAAVELVGLSVNNYT